MTRRWLSFPSADGSLSRLSVEKSEPACFDKEDAVLIDYHRYVLALLCGKEYVIDGLPEYHLSVLTST
jgi:hypothetical protein